MAFFEDFTLVLKQKWLQYYQDNKHWLVLHTKVAAVKTPDGGMRPPAYLILGVMSTLEPKLAQLMLPFSQLNPDAERLIEVLGLNFDPDSSDAVTIIGDRGSDHGLAPTEKPEAAKPEPKPEPAPVAPTPTPKTPPTPLAVQEVLEESAPVVIMAESEPDATFDTEDAAVATAAAVFGAEALDNEEEDPLKQDVWGEQSESLTEESTTDELEGFSASADDDLGGMGLDVLEDESSDDDLGGMGMDMGLDALEEESADDDLGGMDLEGLGNDADDDDLGGMEMDMGLDALEEESADEDLGGMDLEGLGDTSGEDDDLGGMDLEGLGNDADDDDLGDLGLGGLDDDADDDDLGDLGLGGLDDDTDDDDLGDLDLGGLDDDADDDGLGDLDLDDLGGDMDSDDDTSDLLKGL
jgi:hypothetical protein